MTTAGGGTGAAAAVTLQLPRPLHGLADDQGVLRIPVASGATLAAVLDAVDARFPVLGRRLRDETGALRRYVNVYLDGEDVRWLAGPDTPLRAGQEVRVIASVAGG